MKTFATFAAAVLLAGCASAPPPAAAPAAPAAAAPPAWQQGRAADMAASPLAPLAGRNTATPPNEIALGKLKLPPRFQDRVVGPRHARRACHGPRRAGQDLHRHAGHRPRL